MHHGFTIFAGVIFLGGYIRYDNSKINWIKKWMDKWEINIRVVTKIVVKHPQESYAIVVRAVQLECIFLQRMKKIWDRCLRYWKKFYNEFFCLIFSLGNK